MKLRVLILIILIAPLLSQAQISTIRTLKTTSESLSKKVAADTSKSPWKKGMTIGLNATQTSISNWAAGGEDFTLSGNLISNMYSYYQNGKHSWDNVFDLNSGFVNTTSLGTRKNTDRIELLSKYGYAISKRWDAAVLADIRSQIFRGYTYSGDSATLASTFFAPAYLVLSAGFNYKPDKTFSLYLSPSTSRWTIVANDELSNRGLYGVDTSRHTKFDFGGYLMATYAKNLSKILAYSSKLELFSNYLKDPQNVDLYFTNVFTLKFSKVFSASWSYDMVYDNDVKLFGENNDAPALQVKSVLGAGIQLTF